MTLSEFSPPEDLNRLIAGIPLIYSGGEKVNFGQLADYDKLAVDVSRKFLMAIFAANRQGASFRSFADNALVPELADAGFTYGLSFRDLTEGQEVIFIKDWHVFILGFSVDQPDPELQVVKVGRTIQGKDQHHDQRKVEALSHRWRLNGLEPGKGRWDYQYTAGDKIKTLFTLLNEGNLQLEMMLQWPGDKFQVDSGYYGLLVPNL